MGSIGQFSSIFGGTYPALIWHNFMTEALDGEPVLDFDRARREPVAVGQVHHGEGSRRQRLVAALVRLRRDDHDGPPRPGAHRADGYRAADDHDDGTAGHDHASARSAGP